MELIKNNPLEPSEYVEGAFKCNLECPMVSAWSECPFRHYYNKGGTPCERLCKYPKFIAFMNPEWTNKEADDGK